MTRKEIKELLPILQSFAEGKAIEFRCKSGEWVEVRNDEIDLFLRPNDYRIKPEPKYRPFKNQKECWLEMHKHPDFGWAIDKKRGDYLNLSSIDIDKDFSYMFKTYTFIDGEPFGIKEE